MSTDWLAKKSKKPVSNEQVIEWLKAGRQDLVLEHNIMLVVKLADSLRRDDNHAEDLQQAGCMGLLKACEKYDPEQEVKFSTYATWWIKQAIRHEIYRISTIRKPTSFQNHMYNYSKLTKKLERQPTIDETMQALEVSYNCARQLEFEANVKHISVNSDNNYNPTQEGSDNCFEIADKDRFEDIFRVEEIKFLMKPLSDREKDVIIRRFGLGCRKRETLEVLSQRHHVSRERIRQLEKSALEKMHDNMIRNLL